MEEAKKAELAKLEAKEAERAKEKAYYAAHASEIEAYITKSNKAKQEKQWDQALKYLDEGLEKFPNSDRLNTFKGGYYFDKENYGMAEQFYKKAHELNPLEISYIQNVGLCLNKQNKQKEAAKYYRMAYSMKPSLGALVGLMDIQWKVNDWTDWSVQTGTIVEESRKMLAAGKTPPVNPFFALHLPFTIQEMQKLCASHTRNTFNSAMRASPPTFTHPKYDPNRRIRVGYVSPDLRHHAVGIQIRSMFGYHDRERFEVFAYCVNEKAAATDFIHKKISDEVEHFVELHQKNVKDAATIVNEHKIDILIDVALFTAYSRMDVFATRPAPIQAAWLGLATTTGASYYDYIVADKVVIPEQYEQYYSEKPVHLPHSYHMFDHKQYYGLPGPAVKPTQKHFPTPVPSEKGDQFFYCNHQNNYRLTPIVFYHWVKILKRAPRTTLILKYYNDDSMMNIMAEAYNHGITYFNKTAAETDPSYAINGWPQLLFMHGGGKDHIQQKTLCDLYLDTHHYNGHSTSGDMLWAGVPMIAYPGETMAARAAASFITTTGFPELIVNSWEEYEDRAVYYGTEGREELQAIREKMEKGRLTNPLFDTFLFVKHLEAAYEEMYKNHYVDRKGPKKIYVPDRTAQFGAATYTHQ